MPRKNVNALPQLNHTLNKPLFPAKAQRFAKTDRKPVLKFFLAPLRAFAPLREIFFLGGIAKNQPVEIGVVSQRVQVMIVLRTHTQVRL